MPAARRPAADDNPPIAVRAAQRRSPTRSLLLPLFAAIVLAGCGSTVQEGSALTVYTGAGSGGSGAADGAAFALEQAGGSAAGVPVTLVVPDPGAEAGASAQARIAAAARRAAQDSTAIAYLGEPVSEGTAISVPITNEAGILQVSTGPVAEELLREPGGNDVPEEFQGTGARTLIGLLGTDAGQPQIDPGFAADFEAATGRRPGLEAAYGYEAMSLVLDAIERSEDPLDRLAVTGAALATDDRDSVLGSYSIDSGGLTTLGGPQ